jgi:hypothetical protein
MEVLRSLLIVAGCGLAAASWGCASARASSEPEVPALAVPAPPPRTLPPLEGGPIEAAVPTTPVETQAPERPQQRRRPDTRPAEAHTDRSESSRTENAGDAPPSSPAPDAQPAEPPPNAPALQLAPPGGIPQAEQNVQRQLKKADQDLKQVDYAALAREAQAQYDTAKRFMLLADQAIRDKNLVFAQTLANKAADIAAVLLQR